MTSSKRKTYVLGLIFFMLLSMNPVLASEKQNYKVGYQSTITTPSKARIKQQGEILLPKGGETKVEELVGLIKQDLQHPHLAKPKLIHAGKMLYDKKKNIGFYGVSHGDHFSFLAKDVSSWSIYYQGSLFINPEKKERGEVFLTKRGATKVAELEDAIKRVLKDNKVIPISLGLKYRTQTLEPEKTLGDYKISHGDRVDFILKNLHINYHVYLSTDPKKVRKISGRHFISDVSDKKVALLAHIIRKKSEQALNIEVLSFNLIYARQKLGQEEQLGNYNMRHGDGVDFVITNHDKKIVPLAFCDDVTHDDKEISPPETSISGNKESRMPTPNPDDTGRRANIMRFMLVIDYQEFFKSLKIEHEKTDTSDKGDYKPFLFGTRKIPLWTIQQEDVGTLINRSYIVFLINEVKILYCPRPNFDYALEGNQEKGYLGNVINVISTVRSRFEGYLEHGGMATLRTVLSGYIHHFTDEWIPVGIENMIVKYLCVPGNLCKKHPYFNCNKLEVFLNKDSLVIDDLFISLSKISELIGKLMEKYNKQRIQANTRYIEKLLLFHLGLLNHCIIKKKLIFANIQLEDPDQPRIGLQFGFVDDSDSEE